MRGREDQGGLLTYVYKQTGDCVFSRDNLKLIIVVLYVVYLSVCLILFITKPYLLLLLLDQPHARPPASLQYGVSLPS